MKTKYSLLVILFSLLLTETNAQVFEWAKNWGGDNVLRSQSVCKDVSNNVYSTGYFAGTVDFDPGLPVNMISAEPGYQNVFISKFSSAGTLLWVKTFQGAGGDQQAACVKVDSAGNVYTTGVFYTAADFDPNAGTYLLNAVGGSDIFISKLDSNGNFVWAKNVGAAGEYNQGTALALDHQGDLLVGGHFAGTADFDPDAGINNVTATGSYDVFILKLNSAGNFMWVKNAGGNNSVVFVKDIEVDVNSEIVLTGTFTATVDFDPGPNQYQVINAGGFTKDIYILKLNQSGNFIWAGGMGDINNDRGNSLVTDQAANIFVTGFYDGTVDFNPGNGVDSISGFADVFVLKLNAAGVYQWVKGFGGIYDDEGFAIDLDSNNNIYTTGGFSMPADFDPGPGAFNLSPSQAMGIGFSDIFISKLSPSGNFMWATGMGDGENDEGLSLVTGDSNTVYITGRFYGTADFDPSPSQYNLSTPLNGFEHVFLMKLGPCAPIQNLQSITACHTYTYNGQTYNSSGTYTHNFVTAAGCDSVVTLNLSILFANTNVTQAGAVLTATASGATYQWLKCNPYSILGGATNQQLTAIANGDYAVVVTENGCTDTSNCFTVSGLGMNEPEETTHVKIYPNPAHDIISIAFYKPIETLRIQLFDIMGNLVQETNRQNQDIYIMNLQQFPKGIYTLLLTSKEGVVQKQIIRN